MNNLTRILREVFGISDHAIIETSAYGKQHIAVLHRHVGLVGAMHAGHTHKLLATCTIGP